MGEDSSMTLGIIIRSLQVLMGENSTSHPRLCGSQYFALSTFTFLLSKYMRSMTVILHVSRTISQAVQLFGETLFWGISVRVFLDEMNI